MTDTQRHALLLALLAGLLGCHRRAKEVERCAYLSRQVADCLVRRYDWSPLDAHRAAVEYAMARAAERSREHQRRDAERRRTRTTELRSRQDTNLFAWLRPDLATDTAAIRLAGDSLCRDLPACVVRFWSDTARPAFRLPLPPELARSQVAEYHRPRRGPGTVTLGVDAPRP